MKRNLTSRLLRAVAEHNRPLACLFLLTAAAFAQSGQPAPQTKPILPALLVSDIHFEPFWDPAKVPQLVAAPAGEWRAILGALPSPDQQQRFQSLQQTCHARGADTSFILFDSSLKAMRKHATGAAFAAVSGDLISHAFQCKFSTLFPGSTPESYRAFVEKTLDYVMDELYGALPSVPIYVALGNNDSDCGDYRLDAHSEFLRVIGKKVTHDFPASERPTAEESFDAGGYYSVSLPAPIENARLLVLDDIFMSKNYATCAGKPNATAADAQIAWLTRQLAEARTRKQKIWVMGHIPPGVDLHATMTKGVDVCGGQMPQMFLASEKIADVLVEYGDVIPLAIFAHTHMDEFRLLNPESGGSTPASGTSVAVKMIPSISPINGNYPSFTIAQIDPSTAALVDYKVFAASNQSGVDAAWAEEYDFARSYRATGFTPSALSQLVSAFAADPGATSEASQSYIRDFSAGQITPLLRLAWPQYLCAVSNHTPQAFKSCLCPAAH